MSPAFMMAAVCVVVWNDFYPVEQDRAPQAMKGWRQEVQVTVCTGPETTYSPPTCNVFVSGRFIDADDKPISDSGDWKIIASKHCPDPTPKEVEPAEVQPYQPEPCKSQECAFP